MGLRSARFFVKCLFILIGVLLLIFNVTTFMTLYKTKIQRFNYNFLKFPEAQIEDIAQMRKEYYVGLNQHLWLDVCSPSIYFLCNVPFFPKAPNRRIIISETEYSLPNNQIYAARLFGFLRPPKTGSYVFAISSDDSSELWLSSDENSENSFLIANVGEKREELAWTHKYDYWKYSTQISKAIKLTIDKKYYIEIVHVQGGSKNHLVVQWKDSVGGNFSSIKMDYLSPYLIEEFDAKNSRYDALIPDSKSCTNLTKDNPFLQQKHLTYAEHQEFQHILPNKHLQDNKIGLHRSIDKQYDSIKRFFQRTAVYPVKPKIAKENEGPGTTNLQNKVAMALVKRFIRDLNIYYNGTYTVKSIVNIEKTNFVNGSRYLLELDLLKNTSNEIIHLSEYIYQNKNSTNLYYVDQMQWKRNVQITFVITVKDQGIWTQIFLDNMARMLKQTNDPNVDIIIFDYESKDVDLPKAVLASGISHRVKTVSKPGRYSRRESFNLAIDLVEDPHSIVFLVDLHLTFGDALLNDIRKHTLEGELVYFPIIIRLWDCSSPNNKYFGYYGYYELYGFGLVAMYKSDWDRVGGFKMNDDNKYKWGGDDYDLMDSVYLHDLDYVRVKCPYVYHYPHSKKDMWV